MHLFNAGKVPFFFSINGVQRLRTSGTTPLGGREPARRVVQLPSYISASFDGTTTGIPWPVSLEAGLPVSPVLELNACLSVEPTIILGDVNGTTVVPLMFGLGGEYLLHPRLALPVNLAAGPIVHNSGADFGFRAPVGVGYRL